MAPMTYAQAVGYCKSRGEGPLNNADKFVTCVNSAQTKNLSKFNTRSPFGKVNIRGNPVSRKSRKNRKNRKGTRRNRRN